MSSPTNRRRESGKHKERGDKDRKRRRHQHHHSSSSPKASSKRHRASAAAASEGKSPSPYHLVTVSLYLTISPRYSYWSAGGSPEQSPIAGVRKDHLDPMLMSHFEPVDGVVLGYNNVRFESDTARIVAESPFARAWVTVDLLVWRPRRGMLLQGWVNLSSASHMGLLVENTWNVAVGREKIPADWTWTEGEGGRADEVGVDADDDGGDAPSEGYWVDGSGEKVAGLREFKVDGIKAMGHMVSMEGSLLGMGKAKRGKKRKT